MNSYSYRLKDKTLICNQCSLTFCTRAVESIPPIEKESRIETDFHRILPDGEFRAAQLATCPYCTYTWWTKDFAPAGTFPLTEIDAPQVAPWRKFGHAVLSGRLHEYSSIEIAYVALNGFWCAKECFAPADKLLELAKKEFENALADESWRGYRGNHFYQLAEILRYSGDFHAAVKYYMLVDSDARIPEELLTHQIRMAKMGDRRSIIMPPHLIEEIYLDALTLEIRRRKQASIA